MIIRYITLVLFLCISIDGFAQLPDAAGIKNKRIKKITSRHMSYGETDPIVVKKYFDENGNDTAYYENDVRKYYNVIVYDRMLRPLTISRFFPDGSPMDKTVFTYKADGSFSSVNTDVQFGMKMTDIYDKKGKQLSHSIPDGTIIKYQYNAKGQLISDYTIPAKGEKKVTTTYTYNAKGKITGELYKGEGSSKAIYEYDTNGMLKKETRTSTSDTGEKHVSTVEYEYGY